MTKMTKKDALLVALNAIDENQTEVREVLSKMVEQLSKPRAKSDKPTKKQVETAALNAEIAEKVYYLMTGETYKPMTCGEIAEIAEVSTSKMARVLNGDARFAKVKKEKGKDYWSVKE